MRNKIGHYLSFGVATALIALSLQEFFLYLFSKLPVPESLVVTLFGAITGGVLGALLAGMDGFFSGSRFLFRSGLRLGFLIGLVGGAVSFFIINQIIQHTNLAESSLIIMNSLLISRWVVIALCIGLAVSFRDGNHMVSIRSISSGLIAGLSSGIAMTLSSQVIQTPFLIRGIGLVILGSVFAIALYQFSFLGRKVWLKVLNGKLEGVEIELSKEILIFGTQDNDDINLQDYQDVQQSHAKLIRYFENYSLVDNDPFCQTFVNFRGIKEQFLKNGDILKIGTALFQYCTVE
jgi:type III secretion system (T3SS) inner membrane Yop/YscD-like protein